MKHAFIASNRFGLGPRGDELKRVSADPKAWLRHQLAAPQTPQQLQPDAQADALMQLLIGRRLERQQKQQALRDLRRVYRQETRRRLAEHATSAQPFIERLVMFWSNHFTVSISKPMLPGLVNRYEYDAIRPHIGGYFEDLLIAVMQHPAMLTYLDNVRSIGPHSRLGKRRSGGLNENLAREVLELHTLGVDGGYTQQDIIALANILTGWSLNRRRDGANIGYRFHAAAHEPGKQTLLGTTLRNDGEQQGIAALRMLARHPATARHIATRLARHFLADRPSSRSIDTLQQAYRDSGGHLGTVMRALLDLDAAWTPPSKLRNPYEYLVAATRLLGIEDNAEALMKGIVALNFQPFKAPSPAGFPDVASAWSAPDAIMKRIEWAHRIAQALPRRLQASTLLQRAGDDALSEHTRDSIGNAASREDAIAMLLVSPELQRR